MLVVAVVSHIDLHSCDFTAEGVDAGSVIRRRGRAYVSPRRLIIRGIRTGRETWRIAASPGRFAAISHRHATFAATFVARAGAISPAMAR